jgi:hypothetical protein
MSRVLAASAFIAKMCRGDGRRSDPQSRMVEHAPFAGVVLSRDVDARLLVKPPHWQPELLRDIPGFIQDDAVRNEQRVDVTSDARGIVGERHRRPADDEDVGDYAPAHQAVTESGERSFELFPVE